MQPIIYIGMAALLRRIDDNCHYQCNNSYEEPRVGSGTINAPLLAGFVMEASKGGVCRNVTTKIKKVIPIHD